MTAVPALSDGDDAAIRARLDAYAAAWSVMTAAALEPHWDTTTEPLYIAEEIDLPMQGWPAVRAYWAHNEGVHDRVSLRFSDIRTHPLTDDLAQAALHMAWDIAFRSGASRAMGGSNRVVATLRKRDGDWRLTGWVEAPLAPILYMRRLYEAAVTPGFTDGLNPQGAQ